MKALKCLPYDRENVRIIWVKVITSMNLRIIKPGKPVVRKPKYWT